MFHASNESRKDESFIFWNKLGEKTELFPQAESYLRDSLSKSSPIQVKGWTATRLDTSTSWTSWVEASTISLELAWTYGSNWEEDGKKIH